ncbi:MAG TPA: 4'-phosphopantetheinyl transferase superfamily protein [Lachnospiraceae bacterium]|nr:4'-phosphopantetheinyl transferase superfamily protein [Lachnospiraceae bacterium]
MLTILYMEVSPLLNKQDYDRSMVYIDESRKKKVNAARQEKNRILSLAAGLLISYAVFMYQKNNQKMESTVRGLDLLKLLELFENENSFWWDASVKVNETPNGKPYLADHSELFFNVSHSGDYAVLVLSNQEVGVDIQKWKPVSGSFSKRLLHIQESCDFGEENLFSIWTAKEAFVKCTGEGLQKDFKQLFIDFKKERVIDTKTGISLQLTQMQWIPGYSLSVCTQDSTYTEFT